MLKWIFMLLLAVTSQVAMAVSYTLEITEDELQAKLEEMMPIERNKSLIKVILSNPRVDLAVGNNKIGFSAKVDVIAPGGITATGRAKITGTLSYEADTGKFYFREPQIVRFEADNVPPKFLSKVKELAQISASRFLPNYPVYTLSDSNANHLLAKTALKSITVKNNLLLVELSAF